MKKTFLLLLLFSCFLTTIAQEKENIYPQDINKKNELKLDAFSLIVFSSLDITYENNLNKDSSFGVAIFYNFNDIDNDIYFPKKFSLTPYYRWFFTDTRYARGFFVEGFGMLNTYTDEVYYYENNGNFLREEVNSETDFAIGISVGGKFVTKSGFVAEVSVGVGRNLFNGDSSILDNNIVTRGGISLGYRF